jgi:hypothetical protein
LSIDDYITAINADNHEPEPTTSTASSNTRLFRSLNNRILKNNPCVAPSTHQPIINSRPILQAQNPQTIENNHNRHTPILANKPLLKRTHTLHNEPSSSRTNSTPTTSTAAAREVPIALSIKLNPRNSIKKSREEVKTIVERLRNNSKHINYSLANNTITLDDSMDTSRHQSVDNNSTIKRRLRGFNTGANATSDDISMMNETSSANRNNNSYSSNDDSSANSSMVSAISTMSLRSTLRRNKN